MATDNLLQVLESYEYERIPLEAPFLSQALVAATDRDNHECIGKLIKMGATNLINIDECIQLAKGKGQINAMTMLILLKAALTGDKTMLHIFGDVTLNQEFVALGLTSEIGLKMNQAVESGEVSTIYPLKIAQQNGHHLVVHRLLLLTQINKSNGLINWSNLHLVGVLDNYLIKRMCNWVRVLDLSSNKLRSIPAEIEVLTEICSVDLHDNDLTHIPASLLQLPNLKTLKLSNNRLTHLPDIPLWSNSLTDLDLSNNCLSSLPMNATASSLICLNLSNNRFSTVPLCVCTFTTLVFLDLSDNPSLKYLPCEMGMLTKLEQLNLSGLKRLKDPPRTFTSSPQLCFSFLRSKLNNYADSAHCIQLMIVGSPGSGKHTLVSKLQNRELSSHECNSQIYISKWKCRPSNSFAKRAIRFRIWVFNSLEDYASTHDCFLLQHSLYLLTFNVKHESKAVHDTVKIWLERISCRAPHSSIMFIGTHMDNVSHEDYSNGEILLQQVKIASKVYMNKLETIGLLQIELKHRLRTVTQLVDKIHSYADKYPLERRKYIQSNQIQVINELLMKANVYPDEGYVHWRGLQLCQVDMSSLREIYWVKMLNLSRNKLTILPEELGDYLKQVVKVDLQHNDLATIPRCLLELPSLDELNLAHNKLREIPEVPEWSPCLTVLDLSDNQLSSLPSNLKVIASNIRSLSISRNKFRTVPLCVCSFTTLQSLDLSDNSNIVALPAQMGRLNYLSHLNLSGLKKLNDPPKRFQTNCQDCIRYLNNKLRSVRAFYRMRLVLLGNTNRGKTTLVALLQGKEYGEGSTVGVDISEWWYCPSIGRKAFHFSIWDFAGKEEYYSTHQCFLSQHSLYLLVFNLTHGDKGVEELMPWLNNIALRAPHSCVIIVGTHLDEIPDEERGEINTLMCHVGTLAANYNNKLQIVEVLPVGLKNRIENVCILKKAIYNYAASYRNEGGQLIMSQTIPVSYHVLDKQLETVQQEVRQGIRDPIMHVEEFKTMVHQMSLSDVQDDEELSIATLYLTDIGSLLHFDDRGHSLHEIYFIDPCWLCDIMSKVLTIKEVSPFVKNGILYFKDIPILLKNEQFPWQYFEQYLTLLDKFEIALPLDNQRILIPSMLSDERSEEFEDEKSDNQEPVYSRLIMFSSANTPPGFWSRLLARIMHSIPKVYHALDKSIPTLEPAHCSTVLKHHHTQEELKFSIHSMTPTVSKRELSVVDTSAEISLDVSTTSMLGAQVSGNSEPGASFIAPILSHPVSSVSAWPLLPNSPKLLPNHHFSDSFDAKDIHLEYWKTGLYYKDPDIMFRIESLQDSIQFKQETKNGIHLIASANKSGKKIIAQLVDLVVSLVSEWYPGLKEGKHGSSGLEQEVPCFECIKQGQANPFMFKVEQCLLVIAMNKTKLKCGFFHDDPAKNHAVSLTDIVPDLFLQDIDPDFLVDPEDITCLEDDNSLLCKGTYGEIYHGKYKEKVVAIKKYLSHSEESFTEFRSEAKLLQHIHHPCLVCLIGVCVQPLMALVLEEVPLKSLDFELLEKKIPVHRITIFRVATEVAAALRFLHSRGIIYRDLKATNILLWTLDPYSLCHCKLANFGITTNPAPIGARGLVGTKGFVAPEVMHISKKKQYSVYDHRADIFSFSMFVYQLISRRPSHKIDVAVETGERPELQDVRISHTGYHYLTEVMKICWEDNPNNRFDTDAIVKMLCQLSTQMVMCVVPVKRKVSLHTAIAITPSNFAKAGYSIRLQSELWVCCDSEEGTEISIFNIHTMVEINRIFIKDNHIQCMVLCGDQVWMGSTSGNESNRIINIFSVSSRQVKNKIDVHRNQSISCITSTDQAVYMGTLEGYCFFYSDISEVQAKPRCKYISEHAIDGIVCTQQYIWIAHSKYINLLLLDNLARKFCLRREMDKEAYIGQLSFDCDHNIVWSAHLGGVIVSAWDAHNKCHIYDIDTGRHLKRIANTVCDEDNIMTAMTPALDTVWVGMATGHIMVFHGQELLSWFHPYKGCINFLTCIRSVGPCEMEKGMVVSGGKQFTPLVEDFDKGSKESPEIGTLIVWEAYEARTMKQMKLIEQNAPNHLNNHTTVCQMIQEGQFRDGTRVMLDSDGRESPPFQYPLEYSLESNIHSPSENRTSMESSESTSNKHLPLVVPEVNLEDLVVSRRSQGATIDEEEFKIKVSDSEQRILVRCPKPAKLKVLLSEVQVAVAQDHCKLGYYKGEKAYVLQTQESLEDYLRLLDKPQLCIVTNTPRIHHPTNTEEIFIKIMAVMEQSVMLTCPNSAKLDAFLNEITSVGSLKGQKFDLTYLDSSLEREVTTQEDFDRYLSISNRPPLLVKLKQNTSFSINDSIKITDKSTDIESKVATEDVTLHFKLFESEKILDVVCTKPLRLEAVLNDLKLIESLGGQEWHLVYSVDDSYIKVETQEEFEQYLCTASMPMSTLQIISSF